MLFFFAFQMKFFCQLLRLADIDEDIVDKSDQQEKTVGNGDAQHPVRMNVRQKHQKGQADKQNGGTDLAGDLSAL